jgi:hypothetical protein
MVSITLSVSEKTKKLMKLFPEMNWSAFIRKTIEEKVKELTWKEEMLKKLKEEEAFTQWSVQAIRSSRQNRAKELKEKGLL